MILPDRLLRALYAKWPIGRLATANGETKPHCVPAVFCEEGGELFIPVDGKRKAGAPLRRFANVARNPQAALLIDDYTPDWDSLWWVRIDALGDEYHPPGDRAEAIAERLIAKYPQYTNPSLMFDPTCFLRLQPQSTIAWAQSGSTKTIEQALARRPD